VIFQPDPVACRAVLVGVSNYAEPDRWLALPTVRANIDGLRRALTDPDLWGLPPEHCTDLIDPTDRGQVLQAVHEAADDARDLVILYYAGHGAVSDSNLLLTLASTTTRSLRYNSVEYATVRAILNERRAAHAVVLLDCCFSGLAHAMGDVESLIQSQISVTSGYILTSSARDAVSLAPPGETYTAFTGQLLQVLQTGIPDADEWLSLTDITRAVRTGLVEVRRPEPQFSQIGTGDRLGLVRNMSWRPPATTRRGDGRGQDLSVAIDLGVSRASIAVYQDGESMVIPNAEGDTTTPTVVGFDDTGGVLVGSAAARLSIVDPTRTVRSIKREIGSDWSVTISGSTYTAPEIAAFIVAKLKHDAEEYLGDPVTQAVLTVPAYFNDAQRQATAEAAERAGLRVLRIMNEPTAAAITYGLGDSIGELYALMFSLDDGGFDTSVLTVGDGVIEVNATNGDTYLGGDDWTERIVGYLTAALRDAYGIEVDDTGPARLRLWDAASAARADLDRTVRVAIRLPPNIAGVASDRPVEIDLERATFEAMTRDLVDRCIDIAEQAIADADIPGGAGRFDFVVPVGGATRMPAIRRRLAELTGKRPLTGIDPDWVVVLGAAAHAARLATD
jgi:actin-like ATPase involved in cell morphogenesis